MSITIIQPEGGMPYTTGGMQASETGPGSNYEACMSDPRSTDSKDLYFFHRSEEVPYDLPSGRRLVSEKWSNDEQADVYVYG